MKNGYRKVAVFYVFCSSLVPQTVTVSFYELKILGIQY